MATRNREILLANVASMYYLEKRTQAQIAERMGYSRSAISRLITEAENRGIVEIRVHSPIKRNVELEMRVKKRFDRFDKRRIYSSLDQKETLVLENIV